MNASSRTGDLGSPGQRAVIMAVCVCVCVYVSCIL